MNNDVIVIGNLTLPEIANNPAGYPAEVKAASLEVIKLLKNQLREMEIAISSNVINEMILDNASKIPFINNKGESHTLTLKSAPKTLNKNIKDYEVFAIEAGFPNLLQTKVIPISWSDAKELRKVGGSIQEVIDRLYVEGNQTVEIK
jgi:hypothetical protein